MESKYLEMSSEQAKKKASASRAQFVDVRKELEAGSSGLGNCKDGGCPRRGLKQTQSGNRKPTL